MIANQQIGCIVVVLGLPSSGKTTFANFLCQSFEFERVSCQEVPLSKDESAVKSFVKQIFTNYGSKKVLEMNEPYLLLITNLRKRNFVTVVAIETSAKRRYALHCKSVLPKEPLCLEDFLTRQDQFQSQQYFECLKLVQHSLLNHGSIEDFALKTQAQIRQVVRPFRPSWDEYFMKIADVARRRSNCMKSAVGAVIVNQDNRVVSTGYNGTPRGVKSCFLGSCQRCRDNKNVNLYECLCLHAEESAIIEVGISRTVGCRLYTTMFPCFSCAKIIKQAGIISIIFMEAYDKDESGMEFIQKNFSSDSVRQVCINNSYY